MINVDHGRYHDPYLKGMKNVAKVKQIGSGSYTVFKGKNHTLDGLNCADPCHHQGTECMS